MAGIEALLRGRVLGDRYRVEDVIGRGGMGAVYRAADERLGRSVAVKVITAVAGDPESRERMKTRFTREARAAARLPHHPNVVPVYDYGTDAETGLDYIVMELLRGEDLASRLQRSGPPPMALALRILQHAARGVNVGHRMGVIHRDVKPGNIFLVEDGADVNDLQVRVLDFGIAKVVDEEDTQTALTRDGRAPLSPAYASPEQLQGSETLTPASDVFSLGAVGYQMLTGGKPFTEADRNRMGIGVEVPVPSLRSRNSAVPAPVEEVIMRALAHDPGARYPNAGALADAVEAALRRVEGTAAAAAVPAVAGPIVATDADDRTALAGEDDRTALAPRAGAAAAGAAATYAAGSRPLPPPPMDVPPRTGPAIPPPRRHTQVAAPRTGTNPIVWVLLLLALAAGGGAVWYATSGGGGGDDRPLSNLPDSAQKDTTGADTLTAADAPRLDRQGYELIRSGDYAQAADVLRQAVELDQGRAEYKDHLAFALLRQGQVDEAITLLEAATRQNPGYDLSYSHLADARLAQNDTMGAVVALRRFLDVSVNQRDRAVAQQKLTDLTTPRAAPPPPPPTDTSAAPTDTTVVTPTDEPRDTIRIAPPR
ncbi:MAG TPA: protein kinase [Longimicrobium sp.]|nr:protein kinase [Longimicrobium sp.]